MIKEKKKIFIYQYKTFTINQKNKTMKFLLGFGILLNLFHCLLILSQTSYAKSVTCPYSYSFPSDQTCFPHI